MHRFSIGKVIATGALAAGLTFVQAQASEGGAAQSVVVAIDQDFLAAWQKGDAKKLGSIIAGDARIIDGTSAGPGTPAGPAQYLDRAQFLDRAQSVRPRTTLALSGERVVRTIGADADVTIVCGLLKDEGNPESRPAAYTAVYVRSTPPVAKSSAAWVLELYQTSAGEGKPWHYATPPATPWSPDELSPNQRRVMNVVRGFWTSFIQVDTATVGKLIDDDYMMINGPFTPASLSGDAHSPPGASTTAPEVHTSRKAKYLAGIPNYYIRLSKKAAGDTQAFGTTPNGFRLTPLQIVGLGKPDVRFYGAKGDVAIVTLIRSDSDGEASFGFDFKPPWRLQMHDTYVIAGDPAGDNLRIVHEHFTLRQP